MSLNYQYHIVSACSFLAPARLPNRPADRCNRDLQVKQPFAEVGIYRRKQESKKKEWKHALDQETDH